MEKHAGRALSSELFPPRLLKLNVTLTLTSQQHHRRSVLIRFHSFSCYLLLMVILRMLILQHPAADSTLD